MIFPGSLVGIFKMELISYPSFCIAFMTGSENILCFMGCVGLTERGLSFSP